MRYLLDTCILSELTKPLPDKNVLHWIKTRHSDNLYISIITPGELKRGIDKLPKGKKKEKLEFWLESILTDYKEKIIPLELECLLYRGTMTALCEKAGKPLSAIDSLIAAQGLHYGFTVVTLNKKDFTPSGVSVIDPSDDE